MFLFIFGLAGTAVAAPMQLRASGNVDRIVALQNGQTAAVPTGTVSIGDQFSLSARFNTTNAELTELFDADPTINIYNLPSAHINWSIGTRRVAFTPLFSFNASVQIWNDRDVAGFTDSQSFRFFRFMSPSTEVPFDLGAG